MREKRRKRILSALYAANASLQYWLDTGEYDAKMTSATERITQDIDEMRVSIEKDGFCEYARERFRIIGDACSFRAATKRAPGEHILRYMAILCWSL